MISNKIHNIRSFLKTIKENTLSDLYLLCFFIYILYDIFELNSLFLAPLVLVLIYIIFVYIFKIVHKYYNIRKIDIESVWDVFYVMFSILFIYLILGEINIFIFN